MAAGSVSYEVPLWRTCSIPGGKIGVCQVQTFSVLIKLKLLWSIFDKWCVYYTGATTLVFLAQKQIAQGPKSALRPPSGTPTAFKLLSTKCRCGRRGCSKCCCQIFTSVFTVQILGCLQVGLDSPGLCPRLDPGSFPEEQQWCWWSNEKPNQQRSVPQNCINTDSCFTFFSFFFFEWSVFHFIFGHQWHTVSIF